MTLLSPDRTLPPVVEHARLLPVGDRLWRVIDSAGRVIGHLLLRGDRAHERFVARRFHAPSGAFREVGSFWTAREAVECLRLSR